jgi:hypothetical protein
MLIPRNRQGGSLASTRSLDPALVEIALHSRELWRRRQRRHTTGSSKRIRISSRFLSLSENATW